MSQQVIKTGDDGVIFSPTDPQISTGGTNSGSLVTNAGTQTLTNKTLTSPTINSPTISGSISGDSKVLVATATYTSNATPALVTGFSWTVVAGATYIFELNLPTTMTTVGGLSLAFHLTTATLTSIQYQTYAATAADNSTAVSTSGTTATSDTKIFDSKTAAYTSVTARGSFVVGTGGTFAWFASQNTSAAGGDVTSILLGAYARLIRTL